MHHRGGSKRRCRGCASPPPPTAWDDLGFSNTTGILRKKKTMWFIGVEVEQETSAPPLRKNPGSASASLRPSKKQRQQEIQTQMFLIPAPLISGGRLSLSSPTGVLSTQIILQSRVTGVTFHKIYTHLFITLTFLKPTSYLLRYFIVWRITLFKTCPK